ncbi:MAG: Na+/H+ antiporter NhaC family protein, partial [Rikenellaceae bacterium]|nr:Na+/H+ antiporter NhaC family protein [Rikenellaceae bacterium]
QIAERFGISARRTASLLDTFSCFIQGLIPYGAQLLMAAGLAAISPVEIIPHLYYPMVMGACAAFAILIQWPQYNDK